MTLPIGHYDLLCLAASAGACLFGLWTTLRLLDHAVDGPRSGRFSWLFLASVNGGVTIWSALLLALLFNDGSAALAAAPIAVIRAFIAAVAACWISFAILTFKTAGRSGALSGAAFGLGAAAVYYIGMISVQFPMHAAWEPFPVALSAIWAASFGALALRLSRGRGEGRGRMIGVAGLTIALLGMHLIGLRAVEHGVDAEVLDAITAIGDEGRRALIATAALVASLVIGAAASVSGIDARGRAERQRHSSLANASVEALVIVEGGAVVEVNDRFETLTGFARDDAVRRNLVDLTPSFVGSIAEGDGYFETTLSDVDNETAPVEVVRRALSPESGQEVYAIRDLRERARLDVSTDRLADCDPLTGVANRSSFARGYDAAMSEAAKTGGSVALLVIDLVEFTEINDRLGHHAGDDILRRLGARLTAHSEDGLVIGRLNGDVFGALTPASKTADAAMEMVKALAKRLLDEVQAPFDEWPDATVSARIGAVVVSSVAERDLRFPHALARAEAALARAKRCLGEPIQVYDEEIDDSIRRRRLMAQDLRGAVERNEFLLHYQLQASVATGAVTGFEALLRWAHPQRGLVSPMDFVPLTEETGMIAPIGAWVLRQACFDAAAWPNELRVAVNLSPVQIRSADLVETVQTILAESGLAPERLELEVTESTIIEDVEHATRVLNELKSLGLTIAIDDFGTGFASLATLQSFPFDKIKLDRTFLQNMSSNRQSAAIVRAVIALGDSLDMLTLAEGVETVEQLEALREIGCNEAQGYYLGRPAPIEKLGAHVAPWRADALAW